MEQFFNILGPGLFAFIGGAFGGYLTSEWNFRNKLKTTTWEKRQQAYSKIMGLRFLLVEHLHQGYQARIYKDYHEWNWRKSAFSNSFHQREAATLDARPKTFVKKPTYTHPSEGLDPSPGSCDPLNIKDFPSTPDP